MLVGRTPWSRPAPAPACSGTDETACRAVERVQGGRAEQGFRPAKSQNGETRGAERATHENEILVLADIKETN